MSTLNPAFRNELRGVDAYTRHKRLVRDYILFHNKKRPSKEPQHHKTEYDILREQHRFVRSEDEGSTWEERLAKKYYDRLFKEYALCELKYYKDNRIALRWRTEAEVISGKGQFVCASTRCDNMDGLKSWEVNFGYVEQGEKKNELVKVRLCPDCSYKLNYRTQKRAAKRKRKSRKDRGESEDDHDDDEKEGTDQPSAKRRQRSSDKSKDESESDSERQSEDEAKTVWSKPLEQNKEKTKEEEFEDYFMDLLQ